MEFSLVAKNFLSPPILFFFLGVMAVMLKSDLKIPAGVGKFLTLYLLFDIGIKGGQELSHSGLDFKVLAILGACLVMSLVVPYFAFKLLQLKLDNYNAGAIAASYGSVSAVTFATSIAFLQLVDVPFGGYMVAAMAFMESPAIIAGLIFIRTSTKSEAHKDEITSGKNHKIKDVIRESLTNGSVLLLLGSLVIGYIAGDQGKSDLKPFVNDIFKGMLCLYLLDMGLIAGEKLSDLKKSGLFLFLFAILFPLVCALGGIGFSYALHLTTGDALLFTILCGSASYIAVPAAMSAAVPQANMGLLIPMALGVTFPFNIIIGIPLYYNIIELLWK
ncbi:MAG: sodium-dependent bicarbonate transport family permease [Cytophagaceae bacterium]|nr:sodium-dependent bicarbonate transport family permease [Cytophagaceae bacterium]